MPPGSGQDLPSQAVEQQTKVIAIAECGVVVASEARGIYDAPIRSVWLRFDTPFQSTMHP